MKYSPTRLLFGAGQLNNLNFIDQHVCDDKFIRMARALGMEDAESP